MRILKKILKLFGIKSKSNWKILKNPPRWVLKAYSRTFRNDPHQELIWIFNGKHRTYKIVPFGSIQPDRERSIKIYYKDKKKKK